MSPRAAPRVRFQSNILTTRLRVGILIGNNNWSKLNRSGDVQPESSYRGQQRHETARTDFVPAARFELTAHINVRQPDSQQNKNANAKQPGAR